MEATLDDLIEHFDGHGGVSVNMRRDMKRKFKVCLCAATVTV